MIRRRGVVAGFGLAALIALAVYVVPRPDIPARALPERFSDAEFWNIVTDFSEPGGYFRSDNFVSNESTFQWVVPDLSKLKQDGVYLGVGPDQNFTYIAAMHPAVAFITDIRRQNMLLHLIYKALFELSSNRAEFLSKLFGRPLPKTIKEDDNLEALFQAFKSEKSDPIFAQSVFESILDRLRGGHHFKVSIGDAGTIEYVYNAFVAGGPDICYSFPSQYSSWRRFPSYSELMLETDARGENHSYMASEENFQIVKRLETENRIIPIVGDFAGDKALRSVARYLKEHGSAVTAFYTSNVEFYLFQSDDWRKFLNNVSELPVDRNSLFIRAYFNNYGRYTTGSNTRSETLLDGMQNLTAAYEANEIHSYFDVIKRSTAP